jgi:ribonuclease-3
MLANALEALIGAVYLDQGIEAARAFIMQCILSNLSDLLIHGKHRDEKSMFQEIAQEKTGKTPTYKTVSEFGPDHEKIFTCAVFIGEEEIAQGTGNSKQKAEQAAAKAALHKKGWK